MAKEPTTIASYVYAIIDALDDAGVDGSTIVKDVIKSDLPRNDPTERIPARTVSELFAAAVKATGDPCIGLKVGRHIRQRGLHSLGTALMASSTMRDFVLRLSRYFRLVSHSAVIYIEESDETVGIVIKSVIEEVCDETLDAFVTSLIIIIREIYSSRFNPSQIDFHRREPASGAQSFQEFFKCPVKFSQSNTVIHLACEHFDVPLPSASREIAFQNDQIILSYLARLDRGDVVVQTRVVLIEQLPQGDVTKDSVAKELNMTPRTLQYKLSKTGTSFKDLMDDTRKSLALKYLDTQETSITAITFMLGFSDTSNFTRAFKRWMGVSPTDYRQHKLQ